MLNEYDIPIVNSAPDVGKNLFDHFALFLAFKLRDHVKGYALGSSAFNTPSLFKGFPYDWAVSQPLPAEKLDEVDSGEKFYGRNL